jgi:hypothetical protein
MTKLDDLVPVIEVEALEGVDLDMPAHSDGLTLDDLLPVEDGHDLDGHDIEALPTASRRENP